MMTKKWNQIRRMIPLIKSNRSSLWVKKHLELKSHKKKRLELKKHKCVQRKDQIHNQQMILKDF